VPEVIEIQTFLGRVDVRLSVIARDMAHYQHLYRTRVLTLPHISDIETLMQVALIKSQEMLPI
jgi:Lrp/AsnC family transcriptional regulator